MKVEVTILEKGKVTRVFTTVVTGSEEELQAKARAMREIGGWSVRHGL